MALTLAQIRAKLQDSSTRGNSNSTPMDNTVYPHWNIAEGASARLRFLPDGNSKNDFFWVERLTINLSFAGIKGQPESKPVTVAVPCMEMWKDASGKPESCPILAEVRTWFKDPNLEDLGRKYWKKKSYIFQGFVRENPLADDRVPANPIRRYTISPQIFNIIKSALLDPELENMPTDYVSGLDFTVTKSSKGNYADYSTSKWSRRETALTPDETAAIEQYGLFDLSDFLPKKPTAVELQVIKDMFEASVDGQPYDPELWGNYFKPRGFQTNSDSKPDTNVVVESKPVVQGTTSVADNDDVPFDIDEPVATTDPVTAQPESKQRAEDILAMIRNRQK